MVSLKEEIAVFLEEQQNLRDAARQRVALQLACGIDLPAVLAQPDETRMRTVGRLRRIMERERLKGARGQPGYDLDRHIALKRTLDRLCPGPAVSPKKKRRPKAPPRSKSLK